MSVHIKLSTTLRKYLPDYDAGQGLEFNLINGEPVTAQAIALELGLPLNEIKFIMLNGRAQSLSALVHPEDRLAFFPAVGGG